MCIEQPRPFEGLGTHDTPGQGERLVVCRLHMLFPFRLGSTTMTTLDADNGRVGGHDVNGQVPATQSGEAEGKGSTSKAEELV